MSSPKEEELETLIGLSKGCIKKGRCIVCDQLKVINRENKCLDCHRFKLHLLK